MTSRGLRRVVYALVPVCVLGVGAELGLRSAGWPPAPSHFDHQSIYWTLEPGQVSAPVPHPETGGVFAMSTDSRGLRAPLHEGPPADGALRVLAMGCSTTLGWGVDDGDSYPARLEQEARTQGRPDVEVLNGGQPGYTSFQGLWLWDTVLATTQPDIVLLGYVVQDARRSAYTDRSQAILQQDHRYLKDHLLWQSRVYLGLRALVGAVQTRAKERPTGAAPDDAHGVYRVPPDEYRDNLRGLIRRARAVDAQPVLFGYPLEVAGYTQEHREVLVALGAAEDVPVLDLQAEMSAAAATQTLYFPQDRGHANAEGNRWIAQHVWTALLSLGLLDR